MAINKAMRTVLKALSYGDINVQSSRAFANIKAIDPLKRFYRTIDTKIYNGDYEVPTRIYLPGEELPSRNGMEGNTLPVLLFLHGGGWITESVDTYDREASPFPSVQENGTDFLLTRQKLCQYLEYYQGTEADRLNPYFAPILAQDLSRQPRTLILTAQFDPLRDEGEAYGERLREAGNEVEIHRIKDALHGFFALGIKYYHVQESFTLINQFLKENDNSVWQQTSSLEKAGQCSQDISGDQQ